MNGTNPQVDFYFSKAKKWREKIAALRTVVLNCQLTEELKWDVPCYTFQTRNIVLIHMFKDYCALLFFKGALMNDANEILIQQTRNVQAARQIRFINVRKISAMENLLTSYIHEAIEVEKAGLKVNFHAQELVIPAEFQNKLIDDPALKAAFAAQTPGRQKACNLYFSAPEQSKTREARVEKHLQRIIDGLGLDDRQV